MFNFFASRSPVHDRILRPSKSGRPLALEVSEAVGCKQEEGDEDDKVGYEMYFSCFDWLAPSEGGAAVAAVVLRRKLLLRDTV